MSWTPERIARAKKLYVEDGLSASQVAKQLGGVTRSAVIGKAHRLGWSRSPDVARQNIARNMGPQVRRGPAAKPARDVSARPAPPRPPAPAPAPRPAVLDMVGTATSLTLGSHMCKWPIGDPASHAFSFCGRRSDEGRPYCVEHAKVAYQPAQKNDGSSALARSLRRYL